MPIMHTIEEGERQKPILLIVGEISQITEKLLEQNLDKFRVIFVSTDKIVSQESRENLYSLTYEKAKVFPQLEEVIDYSIIILTYAKQREFLKPIFEKLILDKTKSLVLINYEIFATNYDLILEYKKNNKFYFSILGEIISHNGNGKFSNFIKTVMRNEKSSQLQNSDAFTIFSDDALKNIYRLLFGSFKNSTLYYLFYKTPETLISLRQILAKLNPDINISFSDEKSDTFSRKQLDEIGTQKLNMPHVYMNESLTSFEKGLSKLLDEKEILNEVIEKHATTVNTNTDIFPKHNRREEAKQINKSNFIFKSLFGGVILFLSLNIFSILLSVLILKSVVSNIEKSNFKTVTRDALVAKSLFNFSKPFAFNFFTFSNLIDRNKRLPERFGTLEKSILISQKAGETSRKINNPETFLKHEKINSLLSDIYYLYHTGEVLKLTHNDDTLKSLLKSEYSKTLSLTSVFTSFIGIDSEKKYLVLFQDENELRPTGGFITAAGLLKLSNGKFESFKADDIYDLDSELDDHIEPPYPVGRFLQPHLYLRDSNFSLSFEASASISSQIYSIETGENVNGIIAINLKAIEEVLKVTGPQIVAGFENPITDDNFRSHLLTNEKPGDLINLLLNQVISGSLSDHQKTLKILKLLPNLLERKDVLISLSDPTIHKIFSANNYSGAVRDLRENFKNTINDFLYINEANIGNNKVNQNISREAKYESTISDNGLESTIEISLENKSTKEDYKTYIQIAVPLGSELSTIEVNGTEKEIVTAEKDIEEYEQLDGEILDEIELDTYKSFGKTVFAFPIEVPIGEKLIISINYENGAKKELLSITTYSLLVIKQPGTPSYSLATKAFYPENYSLDGKSLTSQGEGFIEEKETLERDFEKEIKLTEKSP